MKMIGRRIVVAGFASMGAAALSSIAFAGDLKVPGEKPVLTIGGKIGVTNVDDTAQFDRAMLEQLGMVKIETNTPWFTGPVTFEGVPMDKLMKAIGAKGEKLVATALNDYSTEIPIEDFAKYRPILAIKRNGEYMPVKDKGPLFIVYPYDSDPELKSQKFYSRSAWQVARLTVK